MAKLADVPFYPTRKPGVADCQVGRLQNRVLKKEFFACGKVFQGIETSAKTGQKGGAHQAVV